MMCARGRAADFLVRREHVGHRQLRALRPRDLAERLERQIRAALHVEQARPVQPVAVAAERQRAAQGADRMHGVDVREDHDPRPLPGGLVAHDQVVGEPVAAGHALDRDRQVGDVGVHQVDHAVDGGGVAGRALGLDPALDAGDHGRDINGIGCHGRSVGFGLPVEARFRRPCKQLRFERPISRPIRLEPIRRQVRGACRV